MKKNRIIFLISLAAVLFISCQNFFSPHKQLKPDEVRIKGSLHNKYISSASEKDSRSALPERIDGITYSVLASADDMDDITGSVTDETFSIILKTGHLWTINVICKVPDENFDNKDYIILTGSAEIDLTAKTAIPDDLEIVLDTIYDGVGYINLPVQVESSSINKCEVFIKNIEGNDDWEPLDLLNFSSSELSKPIIYQTNAGVYDLKLKFYNQENVLSFSCVESITVLNSLVTQKWNPSGVEYIKSVSGENKIYISDLLVNQYKSKYFYVSSLGNDSNAGTYSSPFKTLQKAINVINSVNDGSSTYYLFITGNITATEGDFTEINDFKLPATEKIKTLVNLDLNGKSLKLNCQSYPSGNNFSIDLCNYGRGFTFDGAFDINLKQLTIKNGNNLTGSGGAVLASGGKLNLENVIFLQNKASYGGAIYSGNGNFTTSSSGTVKFDLNAGLVHGTDIFFAGSIDITLQNVSFYSDDSNSSMQNNGIVCGNINQQGLDSSFTLGKNVAFDGIIYTEAPFALSANLSDDFSAKISLSADSSKSVYYGNDVLLLKNKNPSGTDFVAPNYTKFTVLDSNYEIQENGKLKVLGDIITCSVSDISGVPQSGCVYSVATPEDLLKLSELSGSYNFSGVKIVVTDPIDLKNVETFTPIGKSKQFAGTFDGRNNIISNLNVNETTQYAGLFGQVKDGCIKNVYLLGSVTGVSNTGGLVGSIQNNSDPYKTQGANAIENCVVNVKVTSTSGIGIGGIAGSANYYSNISNCINLGPVNSQGNGSVGGIVGAVGSGASSLQIKNCANLGSIKIKTGSAGGVTGNGSCKVYNCYTLSNLDVNAQSSSSAGILAGNNPGTDGKKSYYICDDDRVAVPGTTNSDLIKVTASEISLLKGKLNSGCSDDSYNSWDYSVSLTDIDYPVCLEIPDEMKVTYIEITEATSVNDLIALGQEPEFGKTYSISSQKELNQLALWVNSGKKLENVTFEQTNDIVLSYTGSQSFTPIGNSSTNSFMGTYKGQKYGIKNLNVEYGTETNAALFGYTNAAFIENLYVEGSVKGGGWSGGIVGYADGGTQISSCISNVDIECNGLKVGGIVGCSYDSYVEKCVNLGKINCNNTTSSYVGGIVGYSEYSAIVYYSVNFGSVHANANSAGLLGGGDENSFILYNSYNAGIITALQSSDCGSVCGISDCEGGFTGCYGVSGSCDRLIAGIEDGSEANDAVKIVSLNDLSSKFTDSSFWISEIQSCPVPVDFIPDYIAVTLPQADSGEHIELDETYKSVESFGSAKPSSGDKVKISSNSDFSKLLEWSYVDSNNMNSLEGVTITLAAPIDMSTVEYFGPGVNNASTALDASAFRGTFDGNGYEISNIEISAYKGSSNWHGAGLIGVAGEGAVIKNVHLKNVKFKDAYTKVGAIVGIVSGKNVLIENCTVDDVTISLTSNGRIGGIVGYVAKNASVTIRNCITSGNLSGTNSIGGIAGCSSTEADNGTVIIENCSSYCNITHKDGYTGGIAGRTFNSDSKIKNCFFGGTITKSGTSGQYGPIANVLYGDATCAQNYENLFYIKDFKLSDGTYTQTVPTGVTITQYEVVDSKYMTGTSLNEDIVDKLNAWINSQDNSSIYKKWRYKNGRLEFE